MMMLRKMLRPIAPLTLGLLAIGMATSFDGPVRNDIRHDLDFIVIDPGHGGKDPGAIGQRSKEKQLALAISKKAKSYFDRDENIRAELTRKTDEFIGLYNRADQANKRGADIFVSIHCNASTSHAPHGTETFAMGLHKNKDNLKVMQRENSAILMEKNHEEKYNGFDPKSEEAYIMFKLQQHSFLRQSLHLAKHIETKFQQNTQRKSRGVSQAGYLVLWRTSMPSVLVETGFITNPSDEKFLNSDEGQKYLAKSVYEAIKNYREGNS